MKTEKAILILCLIIVSCNNDQLQKVLVNSDRPDIEKIFHKVVQSESKEIMGVAIVDRSMNTMNFINDDSDKEPEIIYWTKEIFPQSTFISGDSILLYMETNSDKYWELRNSTSSGWIEISTPKFSKNRKEATVDVFFAGLFDFAASYRYFLELNENDWKVTEKKLTSIN